LHGEERGRVGEEAHSVVAGPDGIEYLAFGTRATAEYAFFPRLRAGRIGMLWADMIETHQWKQELALGEPELPAPSQRPGRIVNIDEVEEEDWGQGDVLVHGRDLGIAAGSELTGINYNRIEAGFLSSAAISTFLVDPPPPPAASLPLLSSPLPQAATNTPRADSANSRAHQPGRAAFDFFLT